MNRSRILFVNYSLSMGGIETMIIDMIRLLPAEQFQAEVAVFEGGGSLERTLEENGTPVHRLGKREGIDVGLFWRLRALIRNRKINVVHSHNYSAWLYCGVALRGLSDVRHIHTEHSGVAQSRIRYAVERTLSKVTDSVVAVSDHVADVLTNQVGIESSRIKLILNGVNTKRFVRNADRRFRARQDLGLGNSLVVVGIVARLAPIKNHAYLLRAIAALSGLAENVRLLIVGDGGERKKLEKMAIELGINTRTLFVGERRDTEELLNAMDIYALSSTSEGMNLTLLEAMSSALPVVATAVGGNTEIVLHDKTGYLVPPDDIAKFSNAIERFISDEQLRIAFGDAGRASVDKRFNEHAMIQQYCALYRNEGR
jgi:L-malate glycosyltransferase